MADDPFFADEDGDDFDDLYGRPAPASPARHGERRGAADDAAQSPAPSSRPSDASASRAPVTKREQVTSSELRLRAQPASSVKKGRKVRRKGSQELFDADWEDEAHVAVCTICASGFSLVRRKHHCRPCGRVMCSECSSFLFFESSQRKHRVCAACASDHAAAVGKARRVLNDAVFEHGSDAESSGVADTPSSISSDKRGGFRASVLHAITPSSGKRDKKKEKKGFGAAGTQPPSARVEQPRQVASGTSTADSRDQRTSASLFNNAEDAWFTEPKDYSDDGGSAVQPSKASQPEVGFYSSTYSDGFADSTGGHSQSAAEEWRDKVKASYQLQLDTAPSSRTTPAPGFGFNRNGFSEQFNYDGDDDDDKSPDYDYGSGGRPSMPRPEPIETRMSEQPSSNANAAVSKPVHQEPEQLRQSTLKVNIKGLFHGKSKKEKRKKQRGNKDATPDENQVNQLSPAVTPDHRNSLTTSFFTPNNRMTLDELEVAPKPILVVTTSVRPTFYDDDVDDLVVDDTPGFFEESMAEKLAKKKKEEELQRRMAEDAAWVNSIAVPPSSNNRFSSGQESFSIVDVPSNDASSPESAENAPSTSQPSSATKEHGLTGALKRFFGMSSVKTPDKPAAAPGSDRRNVSKPVDLIKETQQTPPDSDHREELGPRKSVSEGYVAKTPAYASTDRYSIADSGDYAMLRPQERADTLRHTMAATIDASASLGPDAFMVPVPATELPTSKGNKSSKSLQRRDTFDDLFESPKAVDRHNVVSFADSNLPTRSWNTVDAPTTMQYSVGVSRFDARRDEEEDELDFMNEKEASRSNRADTSPGSSREHYTVSQQHVDRSRRDSDDAFDSPKKTSGFTWSSVQSGSGFGTATYAVPAGVPARDSRFGGDRFASHEEGNEHRSSSHDIMHDLHKSSASADRERSNADSVDDIFAQFERPNDYIFDPETGSYIPARQPPRTSRHREAVHGPLRHEEVARASSVRRQSMDRHIEDQSPLTSIGRQAREVPRYEEPYVSVAPTSMTKSVHDRSGNGSESNESDADVIVDKISSLEGELAALKRLIKNRKGGHPKHSQSDQRKPATPLYESTKPRKESIFDGDSDSDKEDPPSRWGVVSSNSRLDKGIVSYDKAKFKQPRKRRDSFASLFDDEAEDEGSIAGNGGYAALFESGATKSDGSGEDESTPKAAKKRRSKKMSKKKLPEVSAEPEYAVENEEEEEFESLKNKRSLARHRRRSSKDRTPPQWAEDSPDEISIATTNSKKNKGKDPESKTLPKKQDENDSIDALFDSSRDADMTNLFGAEAPATLNADNSETATSSKYDSLTSPESLKDRQLSDSSENDESDKDSVPPTLSTEKDVINQSTVLTFAVPPSVSVALTNGGDTSESDEEFAINWKKVKTGRGRRQARSSIGQPASFVSVTRSGIFDDDDDVTTEQPTSMTESITLRGNEEHATEEPELPIAPAVASITELLQSSDDTNPVLSSEADPSVNDIPAPQEESTNDVTMSKTELATLIEESATLSIAPSFNTNEEEAVDQSHSKPRIDGIDTTKAVSAPTFDDDMGLFDNSKDVDIHALLGPTIEEPDVIATTDSSTRDESDEGENESDRDDEDFSFEVRPTRRKTPAAALDFSPVRRPSSTPSVLSQNDDSADSFVLGRYSRAPSSRTESTPPMHEDADADPAENFSLSDSVSNDSDVLSSVAGDEPPTTTPDSADAFDTDWQAMQEQEKERKKKLQMKQRQAQRDKLKKQHSKAAVSSASAVQGKAKTAKKKKKSDDPARKHRHRDKDKRVDATSEDTRSLTEL